MTDNMPDFDSMSPEEIMAWMETLAKRQGASEGFMTAADMDIAEIDPDTVILDEPGYVPFGQEPSESQKSKPQPTPQSAVTPPDEPTHLAIPIPPPPPAAPERSVQQPVARIDETFVEPENEEGSLAWLESLAADQGDTLFNLDLSGLSEEQQAEPAAAATDPVSWLEDMARNQGEIPTMQTPVAPRPAETDAMTWLESLARRQGANPEEFTTAADLDLPAPAEEVEAPAYTPFSFDTPTIHRTPSATSEPLNLEDPTSFLGTLASEQGYSEEGVLATQPPAEPAPEPEVEAAEPDMSLEGIQQAISEGTVTPEQMQVFLEHETDYALQLSEEPLPEDYDPDAPPIPAELPDWLLEQVGPPPAAETMTEPEAQPAAEQAVFENVIAQAASLDDMPDWLKADVTSDEYDLESIFAQTQDKESFAPSVEAIEVEREPQPELEVDPNDPWVEAFDMEHDQGELDVESIPEWYLRNISDPERIAAVEGLTHEEAEAPEEGEAAEVMEAFAEVDVPAIAVNGLSDEPLPEEELLPLGALQALPDWMPVLEVAEAQIAEAEPETADMPEWLREVEAAVQPEEIPDWLKETLAPEEEAVNIFTEVEPAAQVAEPEPVAIVEPEPQPAPVLRSAPVAATLETARTSRENGDLEGSLIHYETLIRNSMELEAVVEDLSHLVRVHKTPAVYRVLGDGLMRQGKLQAALDTYREALNQL